MQTHGLHATGTDSVGSRGWTRETTTQLRSDKELATNKRGPLSHPGQALTRTDKRGIRGLAASVIAEFELECVRGEGHRDRGTRWASMLDRVRQSLLNNPECDEVQGTWQITRADRSR